VGLIPFLTVKFGLSLFQVSLLTASSIVANSLFSPFFGILSDRHGLKYYLVAGPLFTSIFLSTLGVLPGFYLVLLFLFLGNLGIAAYHPASAAVAGHYGGRRKGLSSSLINMGGNIGNAMGSLIIILILEKAGIEYTPAVMVPGIITALVLLRYAPQKNEIELSGKRNNLLEKIKRVNKKKLYTILVILFVIYTLYIVWITLITYMPLYYTENNISLINIGTILLLFGTAGGTAGLFSGYLYDHFKRGYLIIQILLAIAITLFFFTFRAGGIFSIIFFVAGGFFLIAVQPVCIRMAQDMLPQNMSLASSLILGLGPGLAGVTIIFLGRAADIVGIVPLINYELAGPALSILILIIPEVYEKKFKGFS